MGNVDDEGMYWCILVSNLYGCDLVRFFIMDVWCIVGCVCLCVVGLFLLFIEYFYGLE